MLESIVFAGSAVRFLQRDSLIVGIEAWYWFLKGREEQTCHGELVSLWAFLPQRPLVLFQCLHIKKLKKTLAGRYPLLCSKCSESTSVLHHARELKAFVRPGCGGWDAVCCTWNPGYTWSTLQPLSLHSGCWQKAWDCTEIGRLSPHPHKDWGLFSLCEKGRLIRLNKNPGWVWRQMTNG